MKLNEPILKFYTLLYIRDQHHETASENGNANILDYIKCCRTLHNSLARFGYHLTILTNHPDRILQYDSTLSVRKINTELALPEDIRFYAAHYKIDAFKYFSTLDNEYSVLLDSDIVCINDIPQNFKNIIEKNIPVYYDISDQSYPAYGRQKVIDDKTLIMSSVSIGNWAGGELIGGDRFFWKNLYELSMKYFEPYIKNYKQLHHQGDEALVSCAIEYLQTNNTKILNIGTLGIISRYWSVKTLHVGRPLQALYDNFLLHLPADKVFLANYHFKNENAFIKDYQLYLRFKLFYKINHILKKMYRKVANRPS